MGSDLEAELDRALVDGPFHLALSLAVRRRGLGLGRLQCRLAERGIKISTATLSYWCTGRSQPERAESLHGVAVLEELLSLPAGSLVGLLRSPRARPRGGRRSNRDLDLRAWDSDEVLQLAEPLNIPKRSGLQTLSIDEQITLGAVGGDQRCRVRQTLVALEDGANRLVELWQADEPGGPPARYTDLRGYRIGEVRWEADRGFLGTELLLDRPLAAGDTTAVEHVVHVPGPTDSTRLGRILAHRVRMYTLQIVFAGGVVPARCEAFHQTSLTAPEDGLREVLPDHIPSVCMVVTDARPGVYGIRLDW
ncbi:hypothetical protein Lfu02_76510 [Longispora fulva]|uniref:Uncharacterized protein n=1 Tax=Longispora fulva TaxID=619741 RepID=A0A8J7GI22_9ACTN|nr:hypothetical protein [Longispora fulva]MBG6138431.1 hypothetical protein [Longispora fulva]GIG63279.1 hypothetical protein Lfu02_76510 [Longispora fulva]